MPCYHVTLRFLCLTSGVADGILFGTTERGCETNQLSQSVGNNTLRNGLCRHVGTGLVGPNSVLGQWRSQKFSTGVRRSVAFLSVHSRSGVLPSRPYNQKRHDIPPEKIMYFPDRGCVRPLRHLYGYATVLGPKCSQEPVCVTSCLWASVSVKVRRTSCCDHGRSISDIPASRSRCRVPPTAILSQQSPGERFVLRDVHR